MAGLEGLDADAVAQLALLSKELSDNPKTRSKFLRLTKEAVPDISLPELEISDAIDARLSTRDKQIEELRMSLQSRELADEVKKERDALHARGLNDDEVKEVESLMVNQGIADHNTAADYFTWKKQAEDTVKAQMREPQSAELVGQFKDFFKNPVQKARQEAYATLRGLRMPQPAGR